MIKEISVESGFTLVKINNTANNELIFKKPVDSTFIQLHFCIQKSSTLNFGPHYSIDVKENNSLLLYNPNQNLPIDLKLKQNSKHVIFIISIKVFHSFFSQVANLIHFLDDDNKDKKYYLDKELTPSEIVVLNQICKEQIHDSLQNLYAKAKAYELLSLYFNKNEENDQSCPFLDDEENVDKIKQAKKNNNRKHGRTTNIK